MNRYNQYSGHRPIPSYAHISPAPKSYSLVQRVGAGFQQSLTKVTNSADPTTCDINHPSNFSETKAKKRAINHSNSCRSYHPQKKSWVVAPSSFEGVEYPNSHVPDDPETPQSYLQDPPQGESTRGRNHTIHTQEAQREHNNKAAKKYQIQENKSLKEEYVKKLRTIIKAQNSMIRHSIQHLTKEPDITKYLSKSSNLPIALDDPETLRPSQESRNPIAAPEEKPQLKRETVKETIKENDNSKKKIEALETKIKTKDEQIKSFK